MSAGLLVHAAAVVTDSQPYIFSLCRLRIGGAVSGVDGLIPRLDCDSAGVINGIPGVDAEVGQDLVDLGRVQLDRPKFCARPPGETDILADKPLQHPEHSGHGIVQFQYFGDDCLLSGKGQQLSG